MCCREFWERERWEISVTSAGAHGCSYCQMALRLRPSKGSDALYTRSHKGVISSHHRNKIHKEQMPQIPSAGVLHRKSPNQGSLVYLTRVKAKLGAPGYLREVGKADDGTCDLYLPP